MFYFHHQILQKEKKRLEDVSDEIIENWEEF